ncbi:MAG: hypothetical protein ACXAC7_06100 [Candidatus Hodarchaeales archaeon]|jgi:phospholipid N-methyltransferase
MSNKVENYSLYESEMKILKEKNFLLPDDRVERISLNLHQSQTWADVFWRRRHSHSQREDPETSFIFKYNPKTILEVGTAYGRVLKKIAELNMKHTKKAEIIGIEICHHFKQYFHQYKEENPILKSNKIIFDDFFRTTLLNLNYFDIIILPMNTFPSFDYNQLKFLLSTVKKYLTDKGIFILSTYKLPENIDNVIKNSQDRHSGEPRSTFW